VSLTPSAALRLEARGLEHRFAPGRGLGCVSFSHSGPACVAVVGPNGSGKTTLMRIVAGLLRPSRGAVELEVNGRAVPAAARRPCVGFASPDLRFYDELTVGENLAFAAEARGLLEPARAVRDSLERVGLGERAHDRAAALSSGLQQRLRLAFAVLHRPPVLLLDEPGSHLDDAGRGVIETLVDEHRRDGLVLLATNDERESRIADARIELRGGLGGPA
jgi:heme exporter protein A